MRPNSPPYRRKWVFVAVAAFLLLVVGGYTAVFASIHSGVTNMARSAMAQYPGDRVEALCALVDCTSCGLSERNHAVWALGQLRDSRALPVLQKYYTGRQCDHSADLCQYEIRKAIKAVTAKNPLWLGYRDLAVR
jgi:hypothetical protein